MRWLEAIKPVLKTSPTALRSAELARAATNCGLVENNEMASELIAQTAIPKHIKKEKEKGSVTRVGAAG